MGWQPEKATPHCHPQFMILRTESLCLVSCRLVLPRAVSNRLLRPTQTHPQCRRGGGLSISTFVCVCVVKYAMTYKS